MDEDDITLDHYYPVEYRPDLARKWTNLVLSCKRCNRDKDNAIPTEPLPAWYIEAVHGVWYRSSQTSVIIRWWEKNLVEN